MSCRGGLSFALRCPDAQAAAEAAEAALAAQQSKQGEAEDAARLLQLRAESAEAMLPSVEAEAATLRAKQVAPPL